MADNNDDAFISLFASVKIDKKKGKTKSKENTPLNKAIASTLQAREKAIHTASAATAVHKSPPREVGKYPPPETMLREIAHLDHSLARTIQGTALPKTKEWNSIMVGAPHGDIYETLQRMRKIEPIARKMRHIADQTGEISKKVIDKIKASELPHASRYLTQTYFIDPKIRGRGFTMPDLLPAIPPDLVEDMPLIITDPKSKDSFGVHLQVVDVSHPLARGSHVHAVLKRAEELDKELDAMLFKIKEINKQSVVTVSNLRDMMNDKDTLTFNETALDKQVQKELRSDLNKGHLGYIPYHAVYVILDQIYIKHAELDFMMDALRERLILEGKLPPPSVSPWKITLVKGY